ncbi:hypothetical protein DERP_014189 [Dermatophagoides pteronyssinus]|uniref:Uncharacterized protein n=1 Tax=Dermatophagoides pteronyssinus TaxID=6956 RepID=A0ABQ8IWJ9_DERPT|nr:hypothetical protein DERP_014189 [Dermatophagoides pteronyssinus]
MTMYRNNIYLILVFGSSNFIALVALAQMVDPITIPSNKHIIPVSPFLRTSNENEFSIDGSQTYHL